MRRSRDSSPDKSKLNELFKRLRKLKFRAKQSFWCCRSCAGYDLGSTYGANRDAGKDADLQGCVFYTQQDAQGLRENGETYLSFGEIEHYAQGEDGKSFLKYKTPVDTKIIGDKIVEICKELGIDYEWDGNPDTRILVKMP